MDKLTLDPSTIPLPTGYPEATLGDVREAMRLVLALGEMKICQCCGGTAKIYARSLNTTMVRILKTVAMHSGGLTSKEIIAKSNPSGGGDCGKLAHFGLLFYYEDTRRWNVTRKGRDFLAGRIEVPARVVLYNNSFMGFDIGKHVHVDDIGGRFDLDEVLSSASVAEAVVGVAP